MSTIETEAGMEVGTIAAVLTLSLFETLVDKGVLTREDVIAIHQRAADRLSGSASVGISKARQRILDDLLPRQMKQSAD